MLLKAFDPPGFLKDFDDIDGQLEQWSMAVSGWVDGNLDAVRTIFEEHGVSFPPQFYNETRTDAPGPVFDQVIGWNGLPGTLRNRWGRDVAFDLADQMFPLTVRMDGPGSYYVGPGWEDRFYRPQDEYCEWHVTRDNQGRIVRVTFTSEPPEYWQALHGDTLADVDNTPRYRFTGDRKLLLDLYRSYVSPEVTAADLVCHEDLVDYTDPRNPVVVYPRGSYNPYNRWNTTGGIMHLTHPANSLSAEINLGAVATVLRHASDPPRPVVDPDALICCAAYGGPNRTSDPTIGSSVNELASLGAFVTLRNPMGLAMHHLDLSGFTTPYGEPVDASFFRVLRGDAQQGLIERAVFEVPEYEGYTVSDMCIGGVPITRGGQIAEHIVVNIVGRAAGVGTFHNGSIGCDRGCCQDHEEGDYLVYRRLNAPCDAAGSAAFDYPPATPPAKPPQRVTATIASAGVITPVLTGPATHVHRRHTRLV